MKFMCLKSNKPWVNSSTSLQLRRLWHINTLPGYKSSTPHHLPWFPPGERGNTSINSLNWDRAVILCKRRIEGKWRYASVRHNRGESWNSNSKIHHTNLQSQRILKGTQKFSAIKVIKRFRYCFISKRILY